MKKDTNKQTQTDRQNEESICNSKKNHIFQMTFIIKKMKFQKDACK